MSIACRCCSASSPWSRCATGRRIASRRSIPCWIITLRDTDCTDDRLASILTMLGDPTTQATLDTALMQRWVRVYRLPTETVRLDSTSVSVYHDDVADESLLQHGGSKDHRPDLRPFKLMLATLDPLGLPICCQPVAGNRSDNPLSVPAYDAAVAALGTPDVLIVGDSKMTDLPTRGHIVAHGSRYLGTYRPIHASAEIADWVDAALIHADTCNNPKLVMKRSRAFRRPYPAKALTPHNNPKRIAIMVDRLGWQISVTNTTPEQYDVPALVAAYHPPGPVAGERGLANARMISLKGIGARSTKAVVPSLRSHEPTPRGGTRPGRRPGAATCAAPIGQRAAGCGRSWRAR